MATPPATILILEAHLKDVLRDPVIVYVGRFATVRLAQIEVNITSRSAK